MASFAVLYEEVPPIAPLREWVSCYWKFTLPSSQQPAQLVHTVPPDATVSLCCLPSGTAVLVGPRMNALRVPVQAGMSYVGLRFVPGGAGPLLGIAPKEVRELVRPWAQSDFADVVREKGIAGLDALVTRWAAKAGCERPDTIVAEVTRRILEADGSARVADLLVGINLGYRQVLRRFYDATGLTPKEFARVRRIREACVQALQKKEPGWAALSAETGFSDQAHMVREFRDIYGWPPRLVHEYLSQIEHHCLTS